MLLRVVGVLRDASVIGQVSCSAIEEVVQWWMVDA